MCDDACFGGVFTSQSLCAEDGRKSSTHALIVVQVTLHGRNVSGNKNEVKKKVLDSRIHLS